MKMANGKPCLSRQQGFLMSMLMADVDGFNELDLDREYFSEFMAMAVPTLAKQHEEFVQECIRRLEIRLTISEAILIEK